jgi:hypothetical protein
MATVNDLVAAYRFSPVASPVVTEIEMAAGDARLVIENLAPLRGALVPPCGWRSAVAAIAGGSAWSRITIMPLRHSSDDANPPQWPRDTPRLLRLRSRVVRSIRPPRGARAAGFLPAMTAAHPELVKRLDTLAAGVCPPATLYSPSYDAAFSV